MPTLPLVALLSGCAIFHLFDGKDDETTSTLPAEADADADTDTDADADTTHHHPEDTGTAPFDTGGGQGGAWEPAGLAIYAWFGVDSSGRVVPVNFPAYTATYPTGYPPGYELFVFGQDYLYGDSSQTCDLVFSVDHASTPNPPAGEWYEWSVASGDSTLVVDTCRTAGVQYGGYDFADIFGSLEWEFAVGPLDPDIEDFIQNYPTSWDISTVVGGSIGGDLFGTGDPMAFGVVDALPVDNQMNVTDYYAFLGANQIPSNPGIRSAYYELDSIYYLGL